MLASLVSQSCCLVFSAACRETRWTRRSVCVLRRLALYRWEMKGDVFSSSSCSVLIVRVAAEGPTGGIGLGGPDAMVKVPGDDVDDCFEILRRSWSTRPFLSILWFPAIFETRMSRECPFLILATIATMMPIHPSIHTKLKKGSVVENVRYCIEPLSLSYRQWPSGERQRLPLPVKKATVLTNNRQE